MAVISVKFLERLYTLAADPITIKRASARGSDQGPTRAFTDWMDAVNIALKDLLLETTFTVTDAVLLAAGYALDGEGVFQINDLAFGGTDVIRFDNEADVVVSGFVAGRPSQLATVLALGTGRVSLSNQDTRSLDANHIITTPRSLIDLAPGVGFARIYYDGTSLAWRVIQHEQGAPLTPSQVFLADAFTADGGTWSVTNVSEVAGNVYTYYLKGAMLLINLRLLGTTVTGPADRLRVELPNDYVAKKHLANMGFVRSDTALVGRATLWQSDFSSRDINIEQLNGELLEGVTDVLGQCWIEIGSQGGEFGQSPPAGGSEGGGGSGGTQPPMFSRSLPNILTTVQAVAAENPTLFQETCLAQGGNWGFMEALVARLRETDTNWGFNCKRGNCDDPSGDALAYYGGSGSAFVGSPTVYVVDVIRGVCGGSPAPAATDVTDYTGAVKGGWLYPRGAEPEDDTTFVPVDVTVIPPAGDAIAVASINFLGLRDPGGWTQSSSLLSIRVTSSQVCIDHSEKNVWDSYNRPGGVSVIGNPWFVAFIDGQWFAATWEHMRPGQVCKATATGDMALRESPMVSWRPVRGELVGFFQSTRARDGGSSSGDRRCNIGTMPWPY